MSESQPQRATPPPAEANANPAGEHGGPHAHRASGRKVAVVLLVLAVVAIVVVVSGILPRVHARKTLAQQTNALAVPDVIAVHPRSGVPNGGIVLPGNMYAYEDAPIYARTNGYLEHWYADIGAHVKKGQLLATISTPEVDQQLVQAKADLATVQTNAGFARQTANRYQDLLKSDAVSQQETENFVTQAASSNSSIRSAVANVKRLQELQSFQRIYAPFNGVITARGIDVGQLIDQGAGRELFHLASTDTLRVYVNVPQIYSRAAVTGTKAQLTFAEFPGRSFEGKLVRTAHSIDQSSRTLLVEVDVDNRRGDLVPGAYTEVHMNVGQQVPTLEVPVSALMFRSEGLRVGTVAHGPNGDTAKLLPITLGVDNGDTVQVVNGLENDALVIQNPPDSLVDGEPVRIVQPQGTPAQQQGNGQNSQQPGSGTSDSGGKGNAGGSTGKEKPRS